MLCLFSYNLSSSNPFAILRYENIPPQRAGYFHGGVGGLSTPPVQCVESFLKGLAEGDFEASGSESDFQNETNKTLLWD